MALAAEGVRREKKRLLDECNKKIRDIKNDNTYEAELFQKEWKVKKYECERDREIQDLKDKLQKKLLSKSEYASRVLEIKKSYKMKIAAFLTGNDKIAQIEEKYKNADALLTATERTSIYNYSINNNILIVGGSGCGKTRGFVCPNALQAHSSYVFTDPKGEILTKTGRFLTEKCGYKIRVLNLDNLADSDYYNPFHYLYPERAGFEERVLTLIETIIMNTNGGEHKGSSDPFWEQAEKCFLQALFFFTACYFPLDLRNMDTCLRLLSWLELADEGDNKDSPLDWWVKERFIPRFGKDHIGVQQYNEFREKASGKTAKSIVMTSVARFAPFRTKGVRRILSADTMNLERLGEEKMAVFVVVPPTNDTFSFMSGMLFTQMFQELQYCATQVHKAEGQRLPVMVRFLLDEFANTCKIPNFERIIAYARSFGIGICPILQSLEQLKAMYEKSWGTIIDNCSCFLYLGNVTHTDTLEYIVKLIGKGTFDKKSTSQSRGRSGSNSTSYDKIGRDLLDVSEVNKLPKSDCLLFVSGRPPFWSKKYDYTSHPNYMYTSDASSEYYFDYHPIKIETPEQKRAIQLDKKIRAEEERLRAIKEQDEKNEYLRNVLKQKVRSIVSGINRETDMVAPLSDADVLNAFNKSRGELKPIPVTRDEEEAYEIIEDNGDYFDRALSALNDDGDDFVNYTVNKEKVKDKLVEVESNISDEQIVPLDDVNSMSPVANQNSSPLSPLTFVSEEEVEQDVTRDKVNVTGEFDSRSLDEMEREAVDGSNSWKKAKESTVNNDFANNEVGIETEALASGSADDNENNVVDALSASEDTVVMVGEEKSFKVYEEISENGVDVDSLLNLTENLTDNPHVFDESDMSELESMDFSHIDNLNMSSGFDAPALSEE